MSAAKPNEDGTWTVTLNAYQRDNLLALLVACWGWAHESEPDLEPEDLEGGLLRVANSGDWCGEIPWKLGYYGSATDWGRPNATAAEIVRRSQQ